MIGDEAAERSVILVVHVVDAAFAEGAGFSWSSPGLILVLVFFYTASRRGQFFLGLRGGAQLMLIKSDEIAHQTVVELECALELGKDFGVAMKADQHVVTGFAAANLVGQLATPPLLDGDLFRRVEERVVTRNLFLDGGIFERGVEDVHRLVLSRHGWQTSFWSGPPPAGCRGGRKVGVYVGVEPKALGEKRLRAAQALGLFLDLPPGVVYTSCMCGRFGLTRPDRLKLERFGVTGFPELHPRFNVAPGAEVLVVRNGTGGREARMVRWGLVPRWAEDVSIGSRMANARADTAFIKPAFRDPMRLRRCLIPVDVFYEWQTVPGQRGKQPFAIALKSGEPFALGGIWDHWKPKAGGGAQALTSCAVLTTDPNALLSPIHDRMPVIVAVARYASWLDPRTPEPGIRELVQPFPSEEMSAWPISTRVNKADADDAGLLEPYAAPKVAEELELF